jgi:hypothetical protein
MGLMKFTEERLQDWNLANIKLKKQKQKNISADQANL